MFKGSWSNNSLSGQVDEDFSAVDYRLQYRRTVGGGAYEDAYVGGDCEVVVVHLDPQMEHLFRVSARGDGGASWSPWSVPQAGSTSLAPHGEENQHLSTPGAH